MRAETGGTFRAGVGVACRGHPGGLQRRTGTGSAQRIDLRLAITRWSARPERELKEHGGDRQRSASVSSSHSSQRSRRPIPAHGGRDLVERGVGSVMRDESARHRAPVALDLAGYRQWRFPFVRRHDSVRRSLCRLHEAEDVSVRIADVKLDAVGHLSQRHRECDALRCEAGRKRLRTRNDKAGINAFLAARRRPDYLYGGASRALRWMWFPRGRRSRNRPT